jgi:hypothetical protein
MAVALPALFLGALVVMVGPNLFRHTRGTQPVGVAKALSAGLPATISPRAEGRFVWLTQVNLQPTNFPSGHSSVETGITVHIVDWTGAARYQFQLPHPTTPNTPTDIQTISADGTRALLDDGTVIDQTGKVVGKIAGLLSNSPFGNRVKWMSDNSAVCTAISNQPVAPPPTGPPPPKSQGPGPSQVSPSPVPAPPYAEPGADHSVTLKRFGLNGNVTSIATVGAGSLGEPSGAQADMTSVLSCSPSSDLAVVARYHDATNNATNPTAESNNMTVALWAIRLSTGAVLYRQPETRMALGRAFFFGSQNGQLVVEFLWNSKVWGSETDVVLQMPSGHPVPLTAAPIPDTAGLSADGTRILRRVVEATDTAIELIDASTGRVIRRVVIPGIVGASAVAEPGGSSFMVDVDGHFALVDGHGGISVLNLGFRPGGPDNPPVGFPMTPGAQG